GSSWSTPCCCSAVFSCDLVGVVESRQSRRARRARALRVARFRALRIPRCGVALRGPALLRLVEQTVLVLGVLVALAAAPLGPAFVGGLPALRGRVPQPVQEQDRQ